MIRRAFPSSKSKSKAQEIERQHGCQKSVNFDHKNEHFSKSVCSFHSGAIFYSSLGQELSSDALVVSILLSERISGVEKVFFMTPKNRDFHEISSFLEID